MNPNALLDDNVSGSIKFLGSCKPLSANHRGDDDKVFSIDGICRTVMARDYKGPVIVGYKHTHLLNLSGYSFDVGKRVYSPNGVSPTLTTIANDTKCKIVIPANLEFGHNKYYIRYLTPREYWRLQGFSDSDFDKVENVFSKSRLYKFAGNAVTVNVTKQLGKNIVKHLLSK